MADVQSESVRWAWDGRVPLRGITLEVGQPDLGKSTLMYKLAADLTRGEAEGDLKGEPVTVVIATAEDSLATTAKPRLLAAGADERYIGFIDMAVEGEAGEYSDTIRLPDDTPVLEKRVEQLGARVLMLDPVVAFMQKGTDSYKDQSVREVLAPLARMADELDLAIFGLMHLNKREGVEVLSRISGSGGFGAAARSVLFLGRDRENEVGRHLVHAKSNLGPKQPTLACHIEPAAAKDDDVIIGTSRIVFDGESDANAEDLLAGPATAEERGALEDACDFLRDELTAGPVPHADILKKAKAAEVSKSTLRRARIKLGVERERIDKSFSDDRRVAWRLPDPNGPKPKARKKTSKQKRTRSKQERDT